MQFLGDIYSAWLKRVSMMSFRFTTSLNFMSSHRSTAKLLQEDKRKALQKIYYGQTVSWT